MKEINSTSVLRELRLRQGLGVRALGQKSSVPAASISRFESGERLVTAAAAQRLARELGVDALTLSLAHNLSILKQRMETGQDGPRRAVSLARTLLETLEGGELSQKQTKTITEALEQLVRMLEEHNPRHTPAAFKKSEEADSYELQMLELGRDVLGRALSEEELRRRREEARSPQPNRGWTVM